MSQDERSKRLDKIAKIHPLARMDHRRFASNPIDALSRNERRQIKKASRRIAQDYNSLMRDQASSGAGYPVDQFVRQLAIEFNHRFASSGTETQPTSFNYLEPFLSLDLLQESAPCVRVREEANHLFDLYDFLDYATASDTTPPPLCAVLDLLPEGVVHHYSTLGDVEELTTLTADGTPFAISGFSIVRHGTRAYWYVLGGEILTDVAWDEISNEPADIDQTEVSPEKRAFLSEAMAKNGNTLGALLPLEGTTHAAKTLLAGETDLTTERHITRASFIEHEHSFRVTTDDPDTFRKRELTEKEINTLAHMVERIEEAGVLWNLAEFLFRLPAYFKFKFSAIRRDKAENVGRNQASHLSRHAPTRSYSKFQMVSALEIVRHPDAIKEYVPPSYRVEVDGFWRRLNPTAMGAGPDGAPVRGRTWVKAHHRWRERPERPKSILVKSSVAAARLKMDLLPDIERDDELPTAVALEPGDGSGFLYVMRCPLMNEEVYKIGWTRRTAQERAKELSSQTGVPMAFAVVESWPHSDAAGLEKAVHISLDRYRFNKRREFFNVGYDTIRKVVAVELARRNRH